MTIKKRAVGPKVQEGSQALAHRLDALLHTMRCIAQYEDELCELAHELKRSTVPAPETGDHLRILLDRIPSHEYVHDLDSANEGLALLTLQIKAAVKTTRKTFPPANGKKSARKSGKRLGTGSGQRA